ncbi:ATP-binding cassette domain-containing protein [Methanobrevibacter sp. DSM 116169]|uniref:ATP-binding cassette domain-containing protein n=1 Tax=Methanobrevibacter sp. DSM 116169 TaxID=3242727 RepID=UPI0038FD0C23
MNKNIIETSKLTKKFGKEKGVNNLNLRIPKGKIYGLLGRNGAGKTTTMKLLLNLIEPTEGKIFLFGEYYKNNPEKIYKNIGSIIEKPGFYSNLTAYENLKILSTLRNNCENEDIVNALEFVGLYEEQEKIFKNYSLGMKQRLGIAAAIMHKPSLLILDEPINGLDPIGIHEIRKFLLKLCKEKNITIFISSHDLSEIEQIADIIGIMHDGVLIDEIDMNKLNEINRKYVEFNISNLKIASEIMNQYFNKIDFTTHDENILRIYDNFEKRGEINQQFVKKNLLVTDIFVNSESLEEYFSKLIGEDIIA